MLLNKEQVIDFLPHRPPFLFVDSIQELTLPEGLAEKENRTSKDLVGSKLIAHFKVTEDLEILAGHFPGNPILPGVVHVEMMAQASAFVSLGLKKSPDEQMQVETLLLGVDATKFRKPALPGMNLEIHCHLENCRGSMAQYSCFIMCEGQKLSEAKFLAKLDVVQKDK